MSVTDRQTDRRHTDGRAIAYSEHEREFSFATMAQESIFPLLTFPNYIPTSGGHRLDIN